MRSITSRLIRIVLVLGSITTGISSASAFEPRLLAPIVSKAIAFPHVAAQEESLRHADGPVVLAQLRQMIQQNSYGYIENAVADRLRSIADPTNLGLNPYRFSLIAGNEWGLPIIQYAANVNAGRLPFAEINRQLRGLSPLTQEVGDWSARFENGLARLPKFIGMTFRGVRLTRAQVNDAFKARATYFDRAFLSTSIQPRVALRFAKRGGVNEGDESTDDGKVAVILLADGVSGHPIQFFAKNNEAEVVYSRATRFLVDAVSGVFEDAELGPTVVVRMTELS